MKSKTKNPSTKKKLTFKILILILLFSGLALSCLSGGGSANATCGSPENIFDNGIWWINNGADDNFECINIYLNGTYIGNTSKLVFGHKVEGFDSWPEVAVFYPSGFIRLKEAANPDVKFGTSVILGPAYWNETNYTHNANIKEIRIDTTDLPSKIILNLSAIQPNFNINYSIQLFDPTENYMKIYVNQSYTCTKQFNINPAKFAQHEGFKLVQFSSMYINDTFHDSDGARYVDNDQGLKWINFSSIGKDTFIFSTQGTLGQHWIESTHSDDFGWQNNTPNVIVEFEDPQIAGNITPQGWIANTSNPNDDNVGLWAHYDGSITNWSVGDNKTISYWLTANDNPQPPVQSTQLPVYNLVITEVYYNTYLPGYDPEEYVRICNPTSQNISLNDWYVTNLDWNSSFPNGYVINAGSCIIITKNGDAFTQQAGEKPDFEMNNTNSEIPDMIGGYIALKNTGDEVFLMNPDNEIADAFIYGNSSYNGTGWIGEPVQLVNLQQFQFWSDDHYLVRHRKIDEFNRGHYIDTNSSDDWDNNRMEDHVRYIGTSRFDYPGYYNHTGNVTLFTSPDSSYNEIINFIDQSNESLSISLYKLNNFHIADHLINASLRNVSVRIFLDGNSDNFTGISDDNKYIAGLIENSGGKVAWMNDTNITRNRYESMHAKYAISDDTDVLIMSGNWGYNNVPVDPTTGNREWGIIIRNNSAVANFLNNVFEDDYDLSHNDIIEYCEHPDYCEPPANFTPNRTVGVGNYTHPFTSKKLTVENMPIELILAPDTSMLKNTSIIGMIKSAGNNSTVYWDEFYAWKCWGIPKSSCTPGNEPNVYLEETINAARRGADVKVLLDDTEYNTDGTNENQDTVDYLNAFASTENLSLKAQLGSNGNGNVSFTKTHNKGMIVDDKVLISSINVNFHSTHLNRELGIIIENKEVADYFEQVFFYDWYGVLSNGCGCVGATQTFTCGDVINESCIMNCNLNSNSYVNSYDKCNCFNITADNILINGNGFNITGNLNNGNFGIYASGVNNLTIINFKIYNFSAGIHLQDSNLVNITSNKLFNNSIGIFSENSSLMINSNTVCGNTNLDFNSSDWLSSSGDNNTCDAPGDWNDTNKQGCTHRCNPCDLNRDGITINDYNDLMLAHKCHLGINQNCNNNYQDWDNLKKEYQCFTNNKQNEN